jgi:hypothetical protein
MLLPVKTPYNESTTWQYWQVISVFCVHWSIGILCSDKHYTMALVFLNPHLPKSLVFANLCFAKICSFHKYNIHVWRSTAVLEGLPQKRLPSHCLLNPTPLHLSQMEASVLPIPSPLMLPLLTHFAVGQVIIHISVAKFKSLWQVNPNYVLCVPCR